MVELKNVSEIAVGLAYSAILLRDRTLAAEVSVIEDRSDDLYHGLEGWVLRAAAEADDPESLRGLLHLAAASERIVDAAQSMCRLVEEDDAPPGHRPGAVRSRRDHRRCHRRRRVRGRR